MKRFKVGACLIIICGLSAAWLAWGSKAQAITPCIEELPPLRSTEPVADVIADLEHYIPERMRAAGVPGLAVALIHDGTVVWTEGFGVANVLTGERVTPKTRFEVASNGKVVAAYVMLRFVEQGILALDKPLSAYLADPWLPPSIYRDQVTLWHILTHSSGLSNKMVFRSRAITSVPGETFSYSGIGFMYAQAVVEEVCAQSFEDLAQSWAFEPLGMVRSSYSGRPAYDSPLAQGHVLYPIAVLFLMGPLVILLLATALVGVLLSRFRRGHWPRFPQLVMSKFTVIAVVGLPLMVTLLFAWYVFPESLRRAGLLCALLYVVMAGVTFESGRRLLNWLLTWRTEAQTWRRALTFVWLVVALSLPLAIAGTVMVPLPLANVTEVNVAYTLQATAGDMARFLVELITPRYLGAEWAAQMRTPQVEVTEDVSWGLGIGIQHSVLGDSLWQWGANTGYKSLMVIYPQQQWGIVILTNSDRGLPLARDIAQRALGGEAGWQIK